MTTTDTIYAKMQQSAPKHMFNVLQKMSAQGAYVSAINAFMFNYIRINGRELQLHNCDVWCGQMLDFIRSCDALTLVKAHDAVVEDYKTRGTGKVYNRGRPIGSKNRNKSYQENLGKPIIIQENDDDSGLEEFIEDKDTNNVGDNGNTTDNNSATSSSMDIADFLKQYKQDQDRQDNGVNEVVNAISEKFVETNRNITELGEVYSFLRDELKKLNANKPVIVEIKKPELPETTKLGIQHKNFPLLLKMCMAKTRSGDSPNIWIVGPAGTGKSTAAEKVAEAMGLNFYTTGALQAKHEVMGFNDANKYVTTPFRQAWEFGGIYCLDEIDASHDKAVTALNGALAGKLCAFPDRIIRRHPDCIIIATANTFGHGATAQYSSRSKQDAASLDRFVPLDWQIDDALEASLTTNHDWLHTVRTTRAKLAKSGIQSAMITPRATIYGDALLNAGIDLKTVIKMVLQKNLTDAQWLQLINTHI